MLRVDLAHERAHLAKAMEDIERGWVRLHSQQRTLADLRARGRNTVEIERLPKLTARMLMEWERHRRLIEARIAHLERQVAK